MQIVNNPAQQSQKSPTTTKLPGSLWCIASYFNPLGLMSRHDNFQVFSERMFHHGANLLCAEMALHGRGFQLPDILADEQVPVRVCGKHILWQKENLLSLLLKHLPDDCDKVCWLDCDVLFHKDDWQRNISLALEKYKVVQGFSFAGMLPKGVEFVDNIEIDSFPTKFEDCSKVYSYMCGIINPKIKKGSGHPGFVWAARREVLEEINFYNECIMGGADLLTARAIAYQQYSPDTCERYSRFQLASYFKWAQKCAEVVNMNFGYVDNIIYHLHHGSIRRRGHDERLATLKALNFNPAKDLEMTDEGLWTVTKEGERLVAPTRTFFRSRMDDTV